MNRTISLEKAIEICEGAFALYGEEGCIVRITKRDDGEGYDYTETAPDGSEAVGGVITAFSNQQVEFLGSSLWFWVKGTDPTDPGCDTRFQVTVVEPTNLVKHILEPWAEDPAFPAADWKSEVAGGETRLGYLDWVANHL